METTIEIRVTLDERTTSHRFARLPIRFARDPSNDLVLPYPFVSRHHGRLESVDATLTIVDHGSMNGIHVRGVRVAKHQSRRLDSLGGDFAIDRLAVAVCLSPPQATTAPLAVLETSDTDPLVDPPDGLALA